MLRWKRLTTATLTDGQETLATILSCPTGRKYRIKFITTDPLADMYLRVYKNADQIVDIHSTAMTSAAPLLPMDLELNVGDVCSAGFYNNGAAITAKEISIGYEDIH